MPAINIHGRGGVGGPMGVAPGDVAAMEAAMRAKWGIDPAALPPGTAPQQAQAAQKSLLDQMRMSSTSMAAFRMYARQRGTEMRAQYAQEQRDFKAAEADKKRIEERAIKEREALEKRAARERLIEQRREARESQRAMREEERNKAREARRLEQEERRRVRLENRQAAERQRNRRAFVRDTLIGGAIGLLGGGADIPSIAGGAAGLGVGAIAGAFGAAGPVAAAAAEIAKVIAEVVANPTSGVLKAARRAVDLQQQAYAFGRAGGFGGGELFTALHPSREAATPIDKILGLTPEMRLQALSSFGAGVPGGAQGAYGLSTTLSAFGLSPAFARLPTGTAAAVAGQGAAMGMAAPTAAGAQAYLSPFSRLLESAYGRGMDQSRLLASIQASIEDMARAGASGINTSAVLNMFGRLANIGTPGGRTGSAALAAVGGITSTLGNVYQSPMLMTMLLGQAGGMRGLRTSADVNRLLGRAPNAKGSAYEQDLIQQIVADMGNGQPQLAMGKLGLLMQQNPQRLPQLAHSWFQNSGLPAGAEAAFMASITGTPLSVGAQLAYGARNNVGGLGGTGATAAFMSDLAAGKAPAGLPTTANALVATDAQTQIANATATLEKLGPAATGAAEGLSNFLNKIDDFSKRIDNAVKRMNNSDQYIYTPEGLPVKPFGGGRAGNNPNSSSSSMPKP